MTVTLGLGLEVYAVVRAPEVGWGSLETVLGLIGAVVLLGVFLALHQRQVNWHFTTSDARTKLRHLYPQV